MSTGLQKIVPVDLIRPVGVFRRRINRALQSVITGQAMVAASLALLYVIGLTVVGLQSAVAIGVVAGLCRLVPYLDVVVGAALSVIVIVSDFHGWGQVAAVALVFLIVQVIDGMYITPRIIGEKIGLHPAVVILSVFAFADWFGFWGVLMVIPVIAVGKVVLTTVLPYYRASRAYWPAYAPLLTPGTETAKGGERQCSNQQQTSDPLTKAQASEKKGEDGRG